MKINTKDKGSILFSLLTTEILTVDEFRKIIGRWTPIEGVKSLGMFTLDEYQGFLNSQQQGTLEHLIFSVQVVLGLTKKKAVRFVNKMNVGTLLSWFSFLEKEIMNIENHFSNIPKVPMSLDISDIYKRKTDFGVYSIIDYIAVRQSLTDEEASKTPLIFAITKLKIDAENSVAKYEAERLQLKKIKKR